jgi:ABC-type polysaccharide/polyol phosphate transport system ATPase subunit
MSQLLGWKQRARATDFHALRDVSFHVDHGEAVGVIGGNGAGKSTLLSLVTGVAEPDEGEVHVEGKVASVLDLGAGLHPDLTGMENVRLNASLLGLSRHETEQYYEEVVEFSGVREFIGDPLRSYSSGMMMRLAFSVAAQLNPDVFAIDEVIAVGDTAFQQKCLARMKRFREQNKTILLASHNERTLRDMCDRLLWLDHGKLMRQGGVEEVLEAYHQGAPG